MHNKLLALSLTSGLSLFAGISQASAGVSLFKDFTQGTPISKYTQSVGYYDCSSAEQKGRCTDGYEFLGEKFTLALIFREDRLETVALIAPYAPNLYPKVSDALSKSFNIIALENEKSYLDMVTLRNTATQDQYVQRFMAFEKTALASGDLTYSYLEVPETVGYKDAPALLAAAPEDVRQASVRVMRDNDSASLVVRFEAPNVNWKHATAQSDETF